MKIFTTKQVREIDSFTVENEPIQSIDLMERAALALLNWFLKNISSSINIIVFGGPGNNGGDGLALARLLIEMGYNVEVYYLESPNYSNDFSINLDRLKKQGIITPFKIKDIQSFPKPNHNSIIVDALYGSGITRPLDGLTANLVNYLNNLNLRILSIDIPSGLFGEGNPFPNNNPIINAETTLTLQFPKLSFFFPENSKQVGKWQILPIGLHPKAISDTVSPYTLINIESICTSIKTRGKFDHKGNFGHSLIVAGSYGMMGAAVLASSACIKTGTGLVTAHIPRLGYSILQNSVPEVIGEIDENDLVFSEKIIFSKFTAIGVGPGIGKSNRTVKALHELLKTIDRPLVMDADALNIIADNQALLNIIPENTIITPHPGEFDRLFGRCESGYKRTMLAIEKSKQYKIIIVLKGAYTQIICPEGQVYFNSTGNAGMATAGSGDVLTGIITSLLSQGYNQIYASIIGVYLHGLSGDLALLENSYESLTATSIINNIGQAFIKISES